MPELTISNLLLFAAFVVPGAVSLQVYRLKVSLPDQGLKDNLLEAVVFSIVNFALLWFLIGYATEEENIRDNPLLCYSILLLSFFVVPIVWPFVLVAILRQMEKLRWIQPRAKTGWDHFFNNLQQGCYIIAQLNDGSYIGGRFGTASHASGYPNPGNLFIEELWEVGEDGSFTGVVLQGQGVILRATDYKYIRVST